MCDEDIVYESLKINVTLVHGTVLSAMYETRKILFQDYFVSSYHERQVIMQTFYNVYILLFSAL
jgi:hypothetical protein